MSDSVRPHRRQPTRLPHSWDSPGKNTGVGCHFLLQCRKVKSQSEVAQSFPTLSNPMDWSLPGSSVHGIFQARVLEWVAIAFSMWRTDSFEKTLILGKIEGRKRRGNRGWDAWMASPIQWTWLWVNTGTWWWTGRPGVLQSMGSQRVGHDWVTELILIRHGSNLSIHQQ